MKNSIRNLILIFLINITLSTDTYCIENFIFNISELKITENGDKISGYKRGEILTNDGISIEADKFVYTKSSNIFIANGNVKIEDTLKKLIIFTEEIKYFKDLEHIITTGKTSFYFKDKYEMESSNIFLDRNKMELSSYEKSSIINKNNQLYNFDEFKLLINENLLKAKNIYIKENYTKKSQESDEIFFKNGFVNLNNNNFVAGETQIKLKKDIFDNFENDPRLAGVSSNKTDNITIVNKGLFTSCKKNDKCPPWSIKSDKIIHDRSKQQIIYENAILQVYDFPILYFPKFFHPDPSVKRQSGFLFPRLNNSSILGSSLNLPYYHVISDNKDFTFKPTLFDNNNMLMLQSEFRSEFKNSSFISDFGLLKNYISPLTKTKNSLTHFFSKYEKKLDLENFDKSNLKIFIENVSNNSYLKVFDSVLGDIDLKPKNPDTLLSGIEISLDKEKFNFIAGTNIYKNLQVSNNDSYQYIFPYYNLSKELFKNDLGTFNLLSKGENNLNNTNNLKTRIINDINFNSKKINIENIGLRNELNIFFKNLNSLGKKDTQYKNSPQSNLDGILEINSALPLIKMQNNYKNYLTPKISLRTNPNKMNNYFDVDRSVDVKNIFNINRLGLDDSIESGTSLTLGLDFKKQNIQDLNKYIDFKLATNFRDEQNNLIPSITTLNEKNSNIFGAIELSNSKSLNLNYNFAIDNKLENFEYNQLGFEYKVNNFVTEFSYIEKNNNMGNTNLIESNSYYKFNDYNKLSFNTRRNEKINLTEYYDLVYEYKNDCLTAGIKYKKTYYEDRDLKPTEDLIFTITFFPITTFEQKIDQNLYRN